LGGKTGLIKGFNRITDFEAYSKVCESFPKLCPRLVPSPLWGLSLANLARMEPRIASVISDNYPELVERISVYWMSLDRDGECQICGGKGNEIDEDWLYFVLDDRGKPVSITAEINAKINCRGLAYLRAFRLLCSSCHLAKHQGYAMIQGRKSEALEWLQKVNGLGSLDEADQLVGKALDIHSRLSDIGKWDLEIGRLEGMDEETRKSVQKLLNHMYSSGFRLDGGWLYYSSPATNRVELLAEQEAYAILAEARKKAGEDHYKDEIWIRCLEEILKDGLEAEGVRVSGEELTLLIRLLLDRLKDAGLFEQLFILESEGKWIARLPNAMYEKVFRRVLEELEKSELASQAKILCEKGSLRDAYLPIFVYVPTSFAPTNISAVVKLLKRVLNEFGLKGEIYYKPDIFTYRGIYSGKGSRASIYSYSF